MAMIETVYQVYIAKTRKLRHVCHDILQQTCYQQADIRTRSHGLRQLVDDKSVTSYQQTCKLIVKTCYPQIYCKLFQQVVTSLQITSCNKPDSNKIVDNLHQVCSLFYGVMVMTRLGRGQG